MEPVEKVNVLLVDDQPENLVALEAVLEGLGQNLVKARSGREALRHLLEQDFAAILLDVQMPDMDGFETAALIRERERSRHTPIIFLTAMGRSDVYVSRGYALGAVDYIIKPFAPEFLRSKVSVFVDLHLMATRIARLNEELKQQAARLEAANQEMEAFAYSVSHDLRAPLRGMQGLAQALEEDYRDQLDDVGREYIRGIGASAERMDQLIVDILAYSRLGRTPMRLQVTDLSAAVAQALAEVDAEMKARGAQVVVEEPLPAVLGHPATLAQVIANLLTNAAKFVAPGVPPRVRVWAEERGEQGRLWVEDNGIGIAPEYQERIFRVFERLHGIEAYPGTGIGLAIVRKGVERMGGQVGVESAVGQGSRFWIELHAGGS